MTRLAVAGLGLIGARHAQMIAGHPRARLAAVIDPDPDRRGKWDVPQFATLREVAEDLDGVVLATPTHLHAEHARLCLSRGWPCLIEKPIADTLGAADQIAAASRETGVPVLVGHHRRYHASVDRLRDLIQVGAIGQPVLANLIWAVRKPDAYFQGNWRAGASGSPVMINLVHDIDVLRALFGAVTEVAALGANPVRGEGRVESGAVSLRFQSGLIASIAFSDTSPSPWGFEAGTGENPNIAMTGQDFMWITGTKGALSFPSMTLWQGAAHWGETPQPKHHAAPKTVPLEVQLDHFLDVIGGAVPKIDAKSARDTLAVALEVEARTQTLIVKRRETCPTP